jgi:hypothetical protein
VISTPIRAVDERVLPLGRVHSGSMQEILQKLEAETKRREGAGS